jgi:MFS family permease
MTSGLSRTPRVFDSNRRCPRPRLRPRSRFVRGLPRAFWILWAGMLVNRAGAFVAPFLALYLVNERHASVERAGTVVALVGFGSLGSGPIAGALADRIGRRPTLALSTTLGAAAMFALGFSRAEVATGAAAFALGFFGEMYRAPAMAMVSDVVPAEQRTRAFGLIYWAVNLGFAVAGVAAGFVATKSYAALFVIDGGTTLAFGAIVVAFAHESRPAGEGAAEGTQLRALLTPYRHGAFVAFALVSLLVGMIFQQWSSTMPLDLATHGLSPATYGALIASNGVLIVLFQPFVNAWTGRARRPRVLALGAALTGVGFGVNVLAGGSVPLYALSVAVWTAGEISMAGVSPSVVADFAPRDLRGSYQGAYQLSWGVAAFLAPVAGAQILGRLGSGALWGTCVVAGFAAALGFLRVVPVSASDGRPGGPSAGRS